MEIKNISGVMNVYNKVKLNSGKTKAVSVEKNTDKIEFNFARSVEAAKADVSLAVSEGMSAQETEEMKAAISSGEYNVSPEDVAQAILEF